VGLVGSENQIPILSGSVLKVFSETGGWPGGWPGGRPGGWPGGRMAGLIKIKANSAQLIWG
jgi:hypothetical protein